MFYTFTMSLVLWGRILWVEVEKKYHLNSTSVRQSNAHVIYSCNNVVWGTTIYIPFLITEFI